MKRYLVLFVFSLIITVLGSGCKKENMCDCIKRTGDIITESRDVSGFDRITVEDNVNVYLTQDSTFSVKVEAGENIVPLIRTKVEDGTLTIRNDNRCNWTRSYKKPFNVYVSLPNLKYLTHKGTGRISSQNAFTNQLDLETKNSGDIEFTVNTTKVVSHMFGYGDITLHGAAAEHSCSIGGDGFLYAKDLVTDYTWIESFTSGLSYVHATDLLIVKIEKAGDVYCYGHPLSVEKSLSGSGQLYLE